MSFHKDIAANATWDLIKWLGGAALVSGTITGVAIWNEFHSPTILVGAILWVILMISTVVLIVFYLKERLGSRAVGVGGFNAGLDNLEPIHLSALQFMVPGDVRESELDAFLRNQGYAVPEKYLDALIQKTNIVERTHDGHARIKPSYSESVSGQLTFKIGKSSELDLKNRVAVLERENSQLKATPKSESELPKPPDEAEEENLKGSIVASYMEQMTRERTTEERLLGQQNEIAKLKNDIEISRKNLGAEAMERGIAAGRLQECEDRHTLESLYRMNHSTEARSVGRTMVIKYIDHMNDHDLARKMAATFNGLRWIASVKHVVATEVTPREKWSPRVMVVAMDQDILLVLKQNMEQLIRTNVQMVRDGSLTFSETAIILHPPVSNDRDIHFPDLNFDLRRLVPWDLNSAFLQKPQESDSGPLDPPRFSVEPISDLIDRVSGASIEFTSVRSPMKNVAAEIVFVNRDGFEVQRIRQGWWLASHTDDADFTVGETKRLSIAVKDLSKREFQATVRNGSLKTEVIIGNTDLNVFVTLKGSEEPATLFSERYQFSLQIDSNGALRLLRRHEGVGLK